MEMVSLPRVLQHMARLPAFARMLDAMWSKRACTQADPYHLVIYGDEFAVGDLLRQDNRRKSLGLYVTFREFGPDVIKLSDAWIPLAVCRSTVARDIVEGGHASVVRTLLRRLFLEDRIASDGIVVPMERSSGGSAVLYFKLGNLVLDGDAQRIVFSGLGASAKLPCLS